MLVWLMGWPQGSATSSTWRPYDCSTGLRGLCGVVRHARSLLARSGKSEATMSILGSAVAVWMSE